MVDTQEQNEEIKGMERSFAGPDEVTTYYIAAPTADDVRGADWNYSKVYTRGLTEGISTSAQMIDLLKSRGVIGPEFERRAQELSGALNVKIEALTGYSGTDLDEKRDLSAAVYDAREELFQWNQRLNGPLSNTCEQLADDARLEYLTSRLIKDANGNSVWASYDGFLEEKSRALALKARYEVMLYLQGMTPDFLENTPEAIGMREADEEADKRAQEIVDASRAVLEEEAKPKGKKSKKSSSKSNSKG